MSRGFKLTAKVDSKEVEEWLEEVSKLIEKEIEEQAFEFLCFGVSIRDIPSLPIPNTGVVDLNPCA